jgi:hypothetical protein
LAFHGKPSFEERFLRAEVHGAPGGIGTIEPYLDLGGLLFDPSTKRRLKPMDGVLSDLGHFVGMLFLKECDKWIALLGNGFYRHSPFPADFDVAFPAIATGNGSENLNTCPQTTIDNFAC